MKGGDNIMNELILFRKSKALTQIQMSEVLGVSVSYYSKIESGNKKAGRNFIEKFKAVFSEASIEKIFFN
jgi:putative transcriptional regulator